MEKITIKFPSYLDSIEVEISLPRDKNIAVLLSGGADSSLLFWLLCKENLQRNLNNNIIPFTIDRSNGAVLHSNRIIQYLRSIFEIHIPDPIIVGNSGLHNSQHVWSGVLDIKRNFKINELFIAGTQNPPSGAVDGEYPLRKPLSKNFFLYKVPFYDCDKRHIMFLYQHYNLLGLFDITHSCGNLSNGKCLECFSCNERSWGIFELYKIQNEK